MLKVWRAFFAHRKHDERGSAEFATALMVLPVLFILIVGSVEMGFYVQTRMRVENIAREAARQVAAGGGNQNERTAASAAEIDDLAYTAMVTGGKCKLSQCAADPSKGYMQPLPTIDCTKVTPVTGPSYRNNKVKLAGSTVTCVVRYPYKGLSGGLMDGTLGLGIGGIMKPFEVSESARAETGTDG